MAQTQARETANLTVIQPAEDGALAVFGEEPSSRRRRPSLLARFFRRLLAWTPFALIVLGPIAAAIAYYGFYASDRFVAEAQFVVRSPDQETSFGIGDLLQGAGVGSDENEAYIVGAYMVSRDALAELEETVGFSDRMSGDDIDWYARWPNIINDGTFEGLFDYFERRVSVIKDATTGVSTLRVEAFSAEDAKEIAAALVAQGETFVNQMNDRAQADAISASQRLVDEAEQRMIDAQAELEALRREIGVVDAAAETELQIKLISEMTARLAEIQAERRRIAQVAPGNPQLSQLEQRIEALQAQIAEERGKVIGLDGSLAASFSAFETLTLKRKFAEEALLAARANLETARAEAIRKQRYLELVVKPRAPDEAREPRRVIYAMAIAVGAFLIYIILWLLYANAREHRT